MIADQEIIIDSMVDIKIEKEAKDKMAKITAEAREEMEKAILVEGTVKMVRVDMEEAEEINNPQKKLIQILTIESFMKKIQLFICMYWKMKSQVSMATISRCTSLRLKNLKLNSMRNLRYR